MTIRRIRLKFFSSQFIIFTLIATLINPVPVMAKLVLTPEELMRHAEYQILFYNPNGNICYSGELSGETNFAKIVNYYNGNNPLNLVLSPEAIAGLIANFKHESALSPFRNQHQYYTRTGNMSETNGYGLAQFTNRSKILGPLRTDPRTAEFFDDYYKEEYGGTIGVEDDGVPDGVPINVNDAWLSVQLDFITQKGFNIRVGEYRNMGGTMGLDYISSDLSLLEALQEVKTAADAARLFVWIYERPDDKPGQASNRSAVAESILPQVKQLSGSAGFATGNKISVNGKKVTLIGGTIAHAVEKAQLFAKRLSGADFHIQEGKRFSGNDQSNPSGTQILEELKNNNKLRDVTVYALDDFISSSQAESLIDTVGEDKKIVFVNRFSKGADFTANNNVLTKIANDHDNVSVADWETVAKGHEDEYFAQDGVSLTESGQTQFRDVIVSAIALAIGQDQADECAVGTNWTKEQIDRYVDNYKSPTATLPSWPAGTKWNCVSTSAFFLYHFTTLGTRSLILGNGKYVTRTLHSYGLPTGNEPRPLAIFSVDSSTEYGHTGLVVSVDGDTVTTIETFWTKDHHLDNVISVVKHKRSYFVNSTYPHTFAYTDKILKPGELSKIINGE